MKLKFCKIAAVVVSVGASHAEGPVYQERGGLVVTEAENTSSCPGKWKKTDVAEFSGEKPVFLCNVRGRFSVGSAPIPTAQ
jgi:hypothetical protein